MLLNMIDATLFTNRRMLVQKGILVAVFFFSPVTDISVMTVLIGMKFCMMVHIDPRQIASTFGHGTPEDPHILNCGHLTASVWKTVSHSVTYQPQLNISLMRAF